jgi:FtsP/CotA-like multicopper oxidase with cupredoxin domain
LSSALVLTRGEPVAITVVNHLRLPTAVHWHGIEVQESYVDGVPGWSGAMGRLAPAIAPGDSFIAAFTPDRAGTFIYHSHSNEEHQMAAGLYGALIVLEPGEIFDSTTERTFVIGANGRDQGHGRINGLLEPAPVELLAGRTYRFRFVSINSGRRVFVSLRSRAELAAWRGLAKDGAALPANQAIVQPARIAMGPGETADFEVTPAEPGSLELEVQTQVDGWKMAVPINVRPPR